MAQIHAKPGARVLLGVTGGIAAYKSPEIVRRLAERGAEVQVVMTRSARRLVGATTFQAVSGRRVRDDLWDEAAEAAMGHIELARWPDQIVVAPATAHFIGSLASGLAGDLLGTLCLASEAPVTIAPAMNRVMWAHPAVQSNVATLVERGVRVLGPESGDQACGEVGAGRMLEPGDLVAALLWKGAETRPLAGVRAVVTAGPTRESIDPVRYITNRSSGRMGFAIAEAAAEAGAEVVLVSGPVSLPTPRAVRRINVETAEQMYAAVQQEIAGAGLFISCAAVSDYRPEAVLPEKIKRSSDGLALELVRAPDTLESVSALAEPPFTVGFAAETSDVERHALEKLERKRIDMIAANRVGPTCGFDRETNALTVLWRGGRAELGECPKTTLARELVELVAERYRAARGTPAAEAL